MQSAVARMYQRSTTRWCYLFLAPGLILTGMFTFYPMIMSWVYSTMHWTGFTSSMDFVGLDNYRELFADPQFWGAFWRSMIFVLVGMPVRVILALLLAIVLNRLVRKLSVVFRTMFFLPVMASASIMGVVMTFMLSPAGGPVNVALQKAHLINEPIAFLSEPNLALWTVLAVHVWKNLGITMIYWLAALQTVPEEYIEAGQIDGAGNVAMLRHIITPLLIPFAMIIIVLTAQENLHAFAIVQAMTGGGPYFRTQVIEIYIYQTAFQPDNGGVPRLGYASAAGVFFGVATLLIALAQLWAAGRVAQTRREMASQVGSPA